MYLQERTRGILYGIIAAVSYGLNPLFAKPLYKIGFSPDAVLFYRYIFAFAGLMLMVKLNKSPVRIPWKVVPWMVLNGVMMFCSSLCLFLSYEVMAVGIASTLLFVYPVMIAVIMTLGFREKMSSVAIASIVIAFSGVAALSSGDNVSLLGILYVILSALAYAVYIVCVKVSPLKYVESDTLTMYCLAIGTVFFTVRLDYGMAIPAIPPEVLPWTCVLLLALLPTMVSLYTTALAIRYVGATATGILGALEPLTGVAVGVLVFTEDLTVRLLMGILLILFGVTLLILEKKILEYLNRKRIKVPANETTE